MRLWSSILLTAAAAVISGATLASSPARADVVWDLNNLQFVLPDGGPDGGTLNGTFSINVYGYLGPVSISTSTGIAMTGDIYTAIWNSSINHPTDTLTIFLSDALIYQRYIQLTFVNPLTTPGIDPIIGGAGGPSFECNNWGCSGGIRYIADNSSATSPTLSNISPIPETSTWAMLLMGFMGVGLIAYRRRVAPGAGFRVA